MKCVASIYYDGGESCRKLGQCRPELAGSGWIFRQNDGLDYFVTAGHVVKPEHRSAGSSIFIRGSGDVWHQAFFLAADDDADVAIMRVRSGDAYLQACKLQDICTDSLNPNENVTCHAMTHRGDDLIISSGRVAQPLQSFGKNYPNQTFRMVQLDMTTVPGMSGAPLFDDGGRMRGMVTKKYSEYGLAIPAAILTKTLARLIERRSSAYAQSGLSAEPGICLLRIDDNYVAGIKIVHVSAGSPADVAGLQPGDLITSVGGNKCKSLCHLGEILNNSLGEVKLEFLRGKEALGTTIALQ